MSISKADLISEVASAAGTTKVEATKITEALFSTIAKGLAAGEKVSIAGFGNFSVKERGERQGRNPRTGEALTVAASKAVKFDAASALKTSLKG